MLSGLVLVGSVQITAPVSLAFVRTYAAAPLRGSTDESEHPTTFSEVKSASLFSVVVFPLTGAGGGGQCMLYSVATDHRILTFANFNTQSVLRWRCYVEEYAPKLFYLQGKLNVLADAFSRLQRFDSLEIIKGKSDMDDMPLQDPTSIMDFYTNIKEVTKLIV